MNIFRMVLAVVLPPLAVWDKGCGTVLLVTVLTVLFWIPGAVAAMFIVVRDMQRTALTTDDRSPDLFSTAQSLKSQPLGTPPVNAPFDSAPSSNRQAASPADPFTTSQPPIQRRPPGAPDDPFDDPADDPAPSPQPPPARPKPPWES